VSGATIVWFRQDLRLRDNPALHAAAATGTPVIPVYIWSAEEEGEWPPGGASRWWLHHSLAALAADLRKRGSRLIFARGRAAGVLKKLAADTGATAVHWNRRYEPAAVDCAHLVSEQLRRSGIQTSEFNGALLSDPSTFLNKSGKPHQIYTAFQRALLHELDPGRPLSLPRTFRVPQHWPASEPLDSFGLLPRRRALVLGHAGGCRSRQQHTQLAMGGRLRGRCGTVLPDFQPRNTGRALRPPQQVHRHLGSEGRLSSPRRKSEGDARSRTRCLPDDAACRVAGSTAMMRERGRERRGQ
jgi:hypothetical protein